MDSLFSDYEDTLIGRKREISSYHFFGRDAGGANQQRALNLIEYAFGSVLNWEPDEIIKKLDDYMINILKLEKVLSYIHWPVEIQEGDSRYILSLLYPDRVSINYTKLVEETYQRVLDGVNTFPREYFAGTDGFKRYCVCIRYLISSCMSFSSVEELYDFLLSDQGRRFLDRNSLKIPGEILSIDMLDVIYTLTKDEINARLINQYYKFNRMYAEVSYA